MTTKKPLNPPKTYKKSKKCTSCKERTSEWLIYETKYHCQKCNIFRKAYKRFPTLEEVKQFREAGLWKH